MPRHWIGVKVRYLLYFTFFIISNIQQKEKNNMKFLSKGVEKSSSKSGEKAVKSGKNDGKSGKCGEKVVKKLVFSRESRWKASRNVVTTRYMVKIDGLIVSGGGFLVSLYSTYCEFPIKVQIVMYAFTICIFVGTDPIHMVDRVLAKPSRYMLVVIFGLFTVCELANSRSLWYVLAITTIVLLIIIWRLNNFWLNDESWNMSRVVEHSLDGDPDNRALTAWQANGKRYSKTMLRSLGYDASEDDIDTFIKGAYCVGFWDCYKFQCDQSKKIEELQIEVAYMAQLKEEKELYQNLYTDSIGAIEDLREESYLKSREINRINVLKVESEEAITLPKDVSKEQFEKVCILLEKGESDRSIENITGVSRYKIKQIKEQRIIGEQI